MNWQIYKWSWIPWKMKVDLGYRFGDEKLICEYFGWLCFQGRKTKWVKVYD